MRCVGEEVGMGKRARSKGKKKRKPKLNPGLHGKCRTCSGFGKVRAHREPLGDDRAQNVPTGSGVIFETCPSCKGGKIV
jgi:DnaJ-class molecular chaperone